MDFPFFHAKKSTEDSVFPYWLADGRRVVFLSPKYVVSMVQTDEKECVVTMVNGAEYVLSTEQAQDLWVKVYVHEDMH
jgi:hypothetical protein